MVRRKSRNGLIDITLDSSGEHILVSNQKSITYQKLKKPGVSKNVPLQKFDILSGPRTFKINPETKEIFAASGSSLAILDLDGARPPKRLPGQFLAISSGNKTYVTRNSREGGQLEIRKLENGDLIRSIAINDTYPTTFVVSTDGAIAALVGKSPKSACLVKLIDLTQGKIVKEIPFPTKVTSLKISPDKKTLAVGCFNRSIQLWDLEKALKP